MCSNSWDFAFRCFERQIALLTPAEIKYDLTGVLDDSISEEMEQLAAATAERLAKFFVEYLSMLIVWSVASVILVAVSPHLSSPTADLTPLRRSTLPASFSSSASASKSTPTASLTPLELPPTSPNSNSPRTWRLPSPLNLRPTTFDWTTRLRASASRSNPSRPPPLSALVSQARTIPPEPLARRILWR